VFAEAGDAHQYRYPNATSCAGRQLGTTPTVIFDFIRLAGRTVP